jgi:DNA polymerase-1
MNLKTRLGLKTEPLFLIDGHAFIYRGFYAYPDFKRSDGFPTSAMYIVFKLILRIMREERPTHLVFVTDGPGPNFRHELLPTYKANRPRMPEGLAAQLAPLKEGLRLLGVPVLESEGSEADDCIASLAGRFKEGRSVVIVGADKDLRQCLDADVVMWDPAQGKEKLVTRDAFVEEAGLQPGQWADFQAMTGDAADNIPGIPKVGPKTAMGLLRRFPSLDLLRANFHRLTAKEQTLLAPHMEQVLLYRELTTLRTDLCAGLGLEDLAVRPVDPGALEFFKTYEFRSLLADYQALVSRSRSSLGGEVPQEAAALAVAPLANAPVRVEPRIVSVLPPLARQEVGLCGESGRWILGTDETEFVHMGSVSELSRALDGASVHVTSYKSLLEAGGLDLSRCAEVFDIELAAYLLSPEERNYSLERIRDGLLGEVETHPENHGQTVLAVGRLLRLRLAGSELLALLRDLEQPLTEVLVRMQTRGIRIDEQRFRDFLVMVQAELDRLTASIHARAGMEFNIRSSQQLADILFSRMGLKSKHKTPGGAQSTSSSVLEGLEHPIVEEVLEFRMYEKLRSTYLEPLPQLADQRKRIHTTFNQLATATGRLSSSNPNLQNIPIRGVLGPRMRSCFVAAPGNLLVAADYSQVELRVLAHMSGDPTLQDAFAAGDDIHARTAGILFDTTEVTPDERRKAKTINFGLLYGMGPQKLGRELGIGLKEAKDFIAVYFSKLSRVREFYEEIEAGARSLGYVTTLSGRRRMLPEINSRNANLAQQARRMAINTVVQGSAADIIKKAMLEVDKSPVLDALGASLILQIHDELLLEAPAAKARDVGEVVAGIMAAVYSLSVPLAVDWGIGGDWSAAHK